MTANEVAFAAAVSSGVVGALGVFFGGWNAWRDRESRSVEAQRSRENERRMAFEARTDDARRAFFVSLVVYLNRYENWMRDVTALAHDEPAPPPPEVGRDVDEVSAELTVFGTDDLDRAFASAMEAIWSFTDLRRAYEAASRGAGGAGREVPTPGRFSFAHNEVRESVSEFKRLVRNLLNP